MIGRPIDKFIKDHTRNPQTHEEYLVVELAKILKKELGI